MFINRDNYETIFLLYVDNELSAAERTIVEEFLNANADLQEEMNILQSAVLPEADLVFVPKTRLYKNASPVESVQESLLLLLDNELARTSKENLLQQIKDNPQISEEWSILQKTVLDKKDSIIFADKRSLHRRTDRVIPMNFWRAAAAVLIGVGIFTGVRFYNESQVDDSIVVSAKPAVKTITKPVENPTAQPAVDDKDLLVAENKVDQVERSINDRSSSVTKDKGLITKQDLTTKAVVLKKEKDKSQSKEVNLVKLETAPNKETIRPRNENEDMAINESPVKEKISSGTIDDTNVGQVKNSFARLAVNEEDPDRFLNMEEDKVTRTKLGGLFRQVKRVVERNTKIKTSNGLRIGGFEIAIK